MSAKLDRLFGQKMFVIIVKDTMLSEFQESQAHFDGFTEWLQTFELYRGKQAEEVFEDESRVVGKFKVERFNNKNYDLFE